MTRMFAWPGNLSILLVAVIAQIPSLVIAKDSDKTAQSPTKMVESISEDSLPNLSKSTKAKKATNLLASATSTRKSHKDKPRNELATIHEANSTRGNLNLVEEQVEKQPLPDLDRIARSEGKLTIGATARVQEAQSKLLFEARIDTGAASCSLHCEEWQIDEESESMEDNIGKDIRVLVSNTENESEWVDSRIEHCVVVKTSEQREMRYKVPMTFRWNDFEKEVVVTLNNRGHMNYPLLLGRNFLEGDFVVDIELGD